MRWKKWLKLLIFLTLIALLFFWLRSDFWAVKKINCQLDNQDCPTLSFEIHSKRAVAALAVESSVGLFYWLDKEGIVLEKTDKSDDLPLVLSKNDPGLEVGQVFEYGENQALMSLLIGLKMHLVEAKVIRLISPREIEVWLDNHLLVLFNIEKNVDSQLDSLQLILSRAKIEGKTVKKIDLRFDKPVIF